MPNVVPGRFALSLLVIRMNFIIRHDHAMTIDRQQYSQAIPLPLFKRFQESPSIALTHSAEGPFDQIILCWNTHQSTNNTTQPT
jgi:hypothetical protein